MLRDTSRVEGETVLSIYEIRRQLQQFSSQLSIWNMQTVCETFLWLSYGGGVDKAYFCKSLVEDDEV